LINVILPLAIGTSIYVLFVPTAHISSWINSLLGKSIYIGIDIKLGSYITCYMSDCLWAYALFFLLLFIQVEKINDLWLVMVECIVFEAVTEFMQYIGVFDGTFDWLDIAFEVASTIVACIVWMIYLWVKNMRIRRNNINKN
jgi:hypothetical protein